MPSDFPALPDFAHDGDRANHEALLARGYRWGGYDGYRDAHSYFRRFPEVETPGDGADRCSLGLVRFDMRGYRRDGSHEDPISYQVEMYFECAAVKPGHSGHAGRLMLYAFPGAELMARLPGLEKQCLAVWGLLSRKERISEP